MTDIETLPPSYTFGKVVGRVIQAIADTADDVDALPQARAAAGKVTFSPTETLRKVADDGTGTGTFVTAGPSTANLSNSGRILDAEGRQGIWLVTGTYLVQFGFTDKSMSIKPFTIAVTAEHTDAAPLDLAVDAPPDPPANVTLVTYTLPAGGTAGQVMTRTSSGSAWATPAVPDVSGLATAQSVTDLASSVDDALVAVQADVDGKVDEADLDTQTASLATTNGAQLKTALAATIATVKAWARNPDLLVSGTVTRDTNGAATSAPVTWPDGTPGTYTADTLSTAFPGAVDAYHITYGSPVTKTYTQPAITRDANGAATNVPAITVA